MSVKNLWWSKQIFLELARAGVRDVVYCAGARNAPLISVIAQTSGDVGLYSFFEERSASFFALGLARRSNRPVAVVTTSGTAAAELLPATIEAFHTGVPLVLITADRPKRLRGSGAPQAIDQTGLFAKFIAREFDLENGEMFSLGEDWNRKAPVHLNICFDEPLIDEPESELTWPVATPARVSPGPSAELQSLQSFLQESGPLAVIVGSLSSAEERRCVEDFLLKLGAPTYLEGPSGLRESTRLQNLALCSGDRFLGWALKKKKIARVLRLGGVPTVRVWRDLDEASCFATVFSVSSLPFSGLSRGGFVCTDLESFSTFEFSVRETPNNELLSADREYAQILETLFTQEPRAEPSMIRQFSKLIGRDDLIYVGNSLPIREWDLAADRSETRAVEANRGVNGIDGQISTFLGLAKSKSTSWALLGDLTTLYDLSGPWAIRHRPDTRTRTVIVNNGGGMIFNRIFNQAEFENRHAVEFSNWAKMWNLDYQKWTSVPVVVPKLADHAVIELVPDAESTQRFWKSYDDLWTR